MDMFDRDALLAYQVDRTRHFMAGIFSADLVDPARKTGVTCDACGIEVPPGKHVYRLGMNLSCAAWAILATDKIKILIQLSESE